MVNFNIIDFKNSTINYHIILYYTINNNIKIKIQFYDTRSLAEF